MFDTRAVVCYVIPMTTTRTYSEGYDGFNAGVAILEAQVTEGILTADTLRHFVRANIVPIHVRDASQEAQGGSDAAGDWLARQSQAARRATPIRYFAGRH